MDSMNASRRTERFLSVWLNVFCIDLQGTIRRIGTPKMADSSRSARGFAYFVAPFVKHPPIGARGPRPSGRGGMAPLEPNPARCESQCGVGKV